MCALITAIVEHFGAKDKILCDFCFICYICGLLRAFFRPCYIPFVFAKFATSALFTIFSSRHLGVSEKFLAVFAIFKAHKILSIFSILAASQVFLITLSILDISAAVSDESRGKYYKVLSKIGMVYCTFQNAKSRTLGCIET